jgi:hypothetical protein
MGVGSVKNGLEEPVRHQRHTLFGPNVIEIEGKSIISLLLDEVGLALCCSLASNNGPEIGHPPILRLPDCQHRPLVVGRLLLLRLLHRIYLSCEHHHDSHRHKEGKRYSIALRNLCSSHMQTIIRMRELSRFTCPVSVFVDGFCKSLLRAQRLRRLN